MFRNRWFGGRVGCKSGERCAGQRRFGKLCKGEGEILPMLGVGIFGEYVTRFKI